MLKTLLLTCLLISNSAIYAEEYLSNQAFLKTAFPDSLPKPKILWITKDIKKTVADILKHKPRFLRTRYWQNKDKSVWILNEVGKTKPITVGVVISNQKIESIKVLSFRESRGWEVKHDFFTNQFIGNFLDENRRLSSPIDGISGATLSVRALKKVAQLALFFNKKIQQ